jgi:trehalose 6-phosphate synthase
MEPTGAGGQVLIASNRGPISFAMSDDHHLTAKRGGGGVVSGLSSVAGHAQVLWVCAALSDADRTAARAAPGGLLELDGGDGQPGGHADGQENGHSNGSAVLMLDIPAGVFQRAYNAVANSTLWFVQHMLYDTPIQPQFGLAFEREWDGYRRYNTAFARALADAAGRANGHPGSQAVKAAVQDYHLTLVPKMLAEMSPGVRIAHFSHTPWAPPEYFRILPDQMATQVLTGLLGADHAGFLSHRWADAFADCCADVLGAQVAAGRREISYQGHVTTIGVHPLGVDAAGLRERASQPDVQVRMAALAARTNGRQLIVRIDRTELSKNIVRGLSAYRELLLSYPQWRGKVTHVAFAYPSRHDLPEYREYTAAVQRMARQIENEFGTPDWEPLILQVDDDYARSLAAYRLADVLLVNPIRDGMNLVAKEGPILSDKGCAVVLSREAGAADELSEHALMINPFDISGTAAAMHEALSMPPAERTSRSAALATVSAAEPPEKWFADQLAALDETPR